MKDCTYTFTQESSKGVLANDTKYSYSEILNYLKNTSDLSEYSGILYFSTDPRNIRSQIKDIKPKESTINLVDGLNSGGARLLPYYDETTRHSDFISKWEKTSTSGQTAEEDWKKIKHEEDAFNTLRVELRQVFEDYVNYKYKNSKLRLEEQKKFNINPNFASALMNYIESNNKFNPEDYTDKNNKKLSQSGNTKVRNLAVQFIRTFEAIHSQIIDKHESIQNVSYDIAFKNGVSAHGLMDLVVIDGDGVCTIYDIKYDNKTQKDFESGKMLGIEYESAINKYKLIDSAIAPADKIHTASIVIKISDDLTIPNGETLNVISLDREVSEKLGKLNELLDTSKFIMVDHRRVNDDAALINRLFPDYVFETQKKEINKEEFIKTKITSLSDGRFQFFNKLEGSNGAWTIADSEAEIKRQVDIYFDRLDSEKVFRVKSIYNHIKTNKAKPADMLSVFAKSRSVAPEANIQIALHKYTDSDWEIVQGNFADILIENGFIGFKKNNTIDLISISSFPVDKLHRFKTGNKTEIGRTTLLSAFMKDDAIIRSGETIPPSTYGNIEILRGMLLLNGAASELNNFKIGEIKVVNEYNSTQYNPEMGYMVPAFNKVCTYLGIDNNLTGKQLKLESTINNIKDNLISIIKVNNISTIDLQRLEETELSLQIINDYITKMHNAHSKTKNIRVEDKVDFSDEALLLMKYLQEAYLHFKGISFTHTFETDKYGINVDSAKEYGNQVINRDMEIYGDRGRVKTSLLGGNQLRSPISYSNKDGAVVSQLTSEANDKTRIEFNIANTDIIKHTQKFYLDSGLSQSTIRSGLTKQAFVNMFERDISGNITNNFKTKNPYDLNSSLTAEERKYLKYFLYNINRFRMVNLTEEERNKSQIEFEQLDKVRNEINDGNYFDIPLIKGNIDSLLSDTGNVGKALWKKTKNIFNGSALLDRELDIDMYNDYINRNSEFSKIYNQYDMSHEARENLINDAGFNYFEQKLDKVLSAYVYSSIYVNNLNNAMKGVGAMVFINKFHNASAGVLKSDVEESVAMYIKTALKGESNINPDNLLYKTVGGLKQISTPLSMALRPATLVKELVFGAFTNMSRSLFGVQGKKMFTPDEMIKAFGIVMKSALVDKHVFNKLDALNSVFGIANMDAHSIPEQTRPGSFTRFLSVGMYQCTTFPEYQNRMSILVAYLMHNGMWDAYSADENGGLQYDFTKDARFKNYLKYKNSPTKPKEYYDELGLYKATLEQFNVERKGNNQELLRDGDPLPDGITLAERNNILNITNSIYGFFDHEKKALLQRTWFGVLFGQYKTYWPGLIERWFKGREYQESTKTFKPKTTENGKVLYRLPLLDEDGLETGFDEITDDDDRYTRDLTPIYVFSGNYTEGLFISLTTLLADVFSPNAGWNRIQNDKERTMRALQALHDLLLGMISAWLVSIGFNKEENSAHKLDHLGRRAIVNAFSEFNPISNSWIFGDTPPWMRLVTNQYRFVNAMFDGDTDMSALKAKFIKQVGFINDVVSFDK